MIASYDNALIGWLMLAQPWEEAKDAKRGIAPKCSQSSLGVLILDCAVPYSRSSAHGRNRLRSNAWSYAPQGGFNDGMIKTETEFKAPWLQPRWILRVK